MVYKEGRHFVLHLMKFVFQISSRRLPSNIQELLDKFPIEEESEFSVKITKAILIFVNEILDYGADLVDITSPQFHEILNSISLHADFLEFLGYYCVKCVSESADQQSDSPAIFLASVTNYLEKIKNLNDGCMDEFWESLNQVAGRIIVRDLEIYKGNLLSLRDPYFQISMVSEKEFIVDVINYILGLFVEAPVEMMLAHEEPSQFVLSPNIEEALYITVNHHVNRFHFLRDYRPINHYYRTISTTSQFDEENFLEYCVCCTRQAVTEYTRENDIAASFHACEHLVQVLKKAKEDGRFTSLDKIDEAARRLITTHIERLNHRRDRAMNILKLKVGNKEQSLPEEKSTKD